MKRSGVKILAVMAVWLGGAHLVAAKPPDCSLQNLGNGVWAAVVNDNGTAGGNAGFVVAEDGIALIDTFEDTNAVRNFLAAVRRISSLPIRFVIAVSSETQHEPTFERPGSHDNSRIRIGTM